MTGDAGDCPASAPARHHSNIAIESARNPTTLPRFSLRFNTNRELRGSTTISFVPQRFGPRGALWAARPLHRTLVGARHASPSRRMLPAVGALAAAHAIVEPGCRRR